MMSSGWWFQLNPSLVQLEVEHLSLHECVNEDNLLLNMPQIVKQTD